MITQDTPYKLAEIIRATWPQLFLYRDPSETKEDFYTMTSWTKFYSSLSESELQSLALLRVIECTNGCIQHAYRDQDPRALSIEDTRKAMNFSMAAMKSLKFDVGQVTHEFTGRTAERLKEARRLYIRAFKENDETAMDEFFECSIECAKTLGIERIQNAKDIIEQHLLDVFPLHTISWGANYLANLTRG